MIMADTLLNTLNILIFLGKKPKWTRVEVEARYEHSKIPGKKSSRRNEVPPRRREEWANAASSRAEQSDKENSQPQSGEVLEYKGKTNTLSRRRCPAIQR